MVHSIQRKYLKLWWKIKKRAFEKNGWLVNNKIINESGQGAAISFSQSGEDMILRHFLREQPKGFFVDIGAHHPVRFSNTFHFYLSGWKGINIDPLPGSMALFNKLRPRDINLEIALGHAGESVYHIFEEGCYNTFDTEVAKHLVENNISPLISKKTLKKNRLDEILEKHLSSNAIDLLSIDAEGVDVEILETNNWSKFRPKYICAEAHTTDPNRPMNPCRILEDNGYHVIARTGFSVICKSES